MFWIIIWILAVISIISSLWSLRGLTKKSEVEKKAEEELFKGKVLFHRDAHSSSSSESPSSESGLK